MRHTPLSRKNVRAESNKPPIANTLPQALHSTFENLAHALNGAEATAATAFL